VFIWVNPGTRVPKVARDGSRGVLSSGKNHSRKSGGYNGQRMIGGETLIFFGRSRIFHTGARSDKKNKECTRKDCLALTDLAKIVALKPVKNFANQQHPSKKH